LAAASAGRLENPADKKVIIQAAGIRPAAKNHIPIKSSNSFPKRSDYRTFGGRFSVFTFS
jgi:hypothetical protein